MEGGRWREEGGGRKVEGEGGGRKVEGGRWRKVEEGGGVSVEKLSTAVVSWLLTCGEPEIGYNRCGIDRRKCCKPAQRDDQVGITGHPR